MIPTFLSAIRGWLLLLPASAWRPPFPAARRSVKQPTLNLFRINLCTFDAALSPANPNFKSKLTRTKSAFLADSLYSTYLLLYTLDVLLFHTSY